MTNISRLPNLPPLPDTIGVQETHWGVILREEQPEGLADSVFAKALKLAAIGLSFLAVGLWILPGSASGPDLIPLKMVATGLCLSLAMLLLSASRSRDVPEVQFDIRRREVRFAVRRGSDCALTSGFAMDHVIGLSVEPIVPGSEHAAMRLHLDGLDEGMLVVSGLRSELEPVATRLRRDLMRPMQRVERRISQAA